MRNIFMDTEFTGLRPDTTLVSIALVTDHPYENTFYAELTDYNRDHINDYLQKNVIDKLTLKESFDKSRDYHPDLWDVKLRGTKDDVRPAIIQWISELVKRDHEKVKIWSDVLTYDWYLFLDLISDPDTLAFPSDLIYYIPFDLATAFEMKGIDPDINREKFAFSEVYEKMLVYKHNALWDARIIRDCYKKMIKMPLVI
ncbi:MAG: 3'-5' exoribonuclease [Paludibacter sp.]|nr:3'-5' exoribonuclease [Paludibacter sp.]